MLAAAIENVLDVGEALAQTDGTNMGLIEAAVATALKRLEADRFRSYVDVCGLKYSVRLYFIENKTLDSVSLSNDGSSAHVAKDILRWIRDYRVPGKACRLSLITVTLPDGEDRTAMRLAPDIL